MIMKNCAVFLVFWIACFLGMAAQANEGQSINVSLLAKNKASEEPLRGKGKFPGQKGHVKKGEDYCARQCRAIKDPVPGITGKTWCAKHCVKK